MLGMFLVGVDSSIIGVVTPKITTSFQAMDDIAWYGSGYMLPHTVLQPTFGSFYKMFNVKAVYLTSIAVFESKSLLLWEVQRWLTRRQLARVFALRRRTRFASSSVV
jgi:MFS family permease